MSIPTIKAGARYYGVTPTHATQSGAPVLELGPAGTTQQVSTMVVQFNPADGGFTGSFIVVGRLMGAAALDKNTPFEPIPYRVGSLNNEAQIDATTLQGWPWSAAAITGPAIIQIPANGMSIALQFAAEAGQMDITSWDLQGNSSM